MTPYAEAFPREHGALGGQMIALASGLADSLSRRAGTDWTPDDLADLHVGTHYATWTIVRADGFRLKLSRHGERGTASFDAALPRGHIVLDRNAPLPFRAPCPIHIFDPWTSPDVIASEIETHAVAPMEGDFRRLRHVIAAREAKAAALARASAELAAVLGPAVSDPRDRDGCSHLLHDGQVLGRVRLSRGGSSSLEVNGLDHDTVIAVAALIKGRLASGAAA